MRASEIFLFLQGGIHNRSITVYPSLVRLLGGLKETVFLTNLIQWLPGDDPQKAIYKTVSQIEEETTLTEKEQVRVRNKLKALGVLKERYARLEHRLYFSLDFNGLDKVLANLPNDGSRTSLRAVGEPTSERFEDKRVQQESTQEEKTPSKKKDPNPDVSIFLKWWCDRYKQVVKDEYLVQWGKEGKLVKELLKSKPIEEVKKRAERLLTTTDNWLRQRRTIPMLLSKWNDLGQQGRSEEQEGPSLRVL